jgi:hypothetical protein
MENDLTRLSLLAIDIADPEIRSLQETSEQITRQMIKAGIPRERMRLIAQSVKFPTAEAMFDFINQNGEYLMVVQSLKTLFLASNNNGNPNGGGWKKKSFGKAIYALNYYQLGIIVIALTLQRTSAFLDSHPNSGFGLWAWRRNRKRNILRFR